jgi:hypothetical protein
MVIAHACIGMPACCLSSAVRLAATARHSIFLTYPMWDEDHPDTIAHDAAMKEILDEADKEKPEPGWP